MPTPDNPFAAALFLVLAAVALSFYFFHRRVYFLSSAAAWALLGILPLIHQPAWSAWSTALLVAAAILFVLGMIQIATEIARTGSWRATELELLLEEDPNMICVVQEGVVVFANRALRERSGRTLSELRDHSPVGFLPAGGRRQAVEIDFRDDRGQDVPVIVHAHPIEWRGSSAWRYELVDISEQREAQREIQQMMKELQRMNAELESSNRRQQEFLSNTTHELKTPLTSIIANTEILDYEMCGPVNEEQRRVLTNIARNSQRLLEMITRLLAFASQREGGDSLRPQMVSIPMLLENVLETVRPLLEEGDLEVDVEVDADIPDCSVDPEKIYRVYLNLVENAIKFSTQGVIRVAARAVDGELEGSVTDQGIGIPLDMLDEVFQPFRQVDAGPTRSYGGVGLGLAICKHLVELHGGRIWAESEPGSGTTIRFRLPCADIPRGDGAPTAERASTE